MAYLGELEQIILLALMRLGTDGYGVTVRREIFDRTGRDVSLGSVYKTLQRMEDKGLVRSRIGEPTPERGGRRKRLYRIRPAGSRALSNSLKGLQNMIRGLDPELEAL